MNRRQSEADRAAADRADSERQAVVDAAARVAREKSERIDHLFEEATSLIPAVLAGLAVKNYEGIRQVEVSNRRPRPLGFGYKTDRVEVGADVVCTYESNWQGFPGTTEFLLLFDGRLMPMPGDSLTLTEFADQVREREGLHSREQRLDYAEGVTPDTISGFSRFVSGLQHLIAPSP